MAQQVKRDVSLKNTDVAAHHGGHRALHHLHSTDAKMSIFHGEAPAMRASTKLLMAHAPREAQRNRHPTQYKSDHRTSAPP